VGTARRDGKDAGYTEDEGRQQIDSYNGKSRIDAQEEKPHANGMNSTWQR